LLRAALRKFADICEILVSAGADVNAAYRKSADPIRIREVLERRNSGADWRMVVHGPSQGLLEPLRVEGVTALHIAAAHGSTRVCECLLNTGSRHGSVDVLMRSALMLAGEKGHVEVTALLLERKAAVGANVDGHSVGTLVARAGHLAIAQLLLESGVMEVNFATWAGGPTMLHVAAHHGRGGCVALLCECDSDVGLPLEPDGICPLMLAASRGHSDICQELIGYGASINEVDAQGKSAWLHAAAAGQSTICQFLTTYGAREHIVARERSRVLRGVHVGPAAAPMPASSAAQRRRTQREAEDTRPAVNSTALMPGGLLPPPAYNKAAAAAAGASCWAQGALVQPRGVAGGDRAAGL